MNIEFHYYITKYLALNAGFEDDEAEIIAYSSQFVDDNFTRFKIETPDDDFYENYITQTMNISKPKKKLLRVYLLYHFMPGDPTTPKVRRRDGKMHILMTTPGNTIAQDIFYSANKDDNLYSLGISSHMLADTFSHQNFVGTFDEINALCGVWETLIPNIGHADARFKPDIPNLMWHDPRLINNNVEVNNVERLLLAAQKLYSNYIFITSMPNQWNKVKKNLEAIFNNTIDETQLSEYPLQKEFRISQYKTLLEDMESDGDYDPNKWFNQSINQDVNFLNDRKFKFDPIKDKFSFKDSYERSHWYRFQESVKEYQKIATKKLEPLLTQLEIKEW
ncbi:MAG: hypothetical protein K8S23_11120 [Candidatus Cloacimonetes bacterium]|nr:hypothetical protein [Candidatus Cloacimonadota bacterium]